MSPLPVNALFNSGQLVETQAGTVSNGSGAAFNRFLSQTGAQSESGRSHASGELVPPTSSTLLSSRPTAAEVLNPQIQHAGNSLSVLNAQVATIRPTGVSESLQNRLDLLNSQFRTLGNNLEQSAAKEDPLQLLRLQNDVYQLDEELELVSKVVDQATTGVRSLLQTQI